MIADTLPNWDKTELANILADRMADAEDLIEALPEIEKAGALEESILDDYIESNWRLILSSLDEDEIREWIEEKNYEEMWEQMENGWAEDQYEREEILDEDYCWSLLELFNCFKITDPAEHWGYKPKYRKS